MLVGLHTPGLDAGYLRELPLLTFDYAGDWQAQLPDKFALFGHGIGGMVARSFAILHPERVERLILCSTAPQLDAGRWLQVMHAMEGRLEGFDREQFLRALDWVIESVAPPVETLIIHGRHDELIGLEEGGQALLKGTPGAELIVMEKSGHFPFLEQPAPFWYVVDEFLQGQSVQVAAW